MSKNSTKENVIFSPDEYPDIEIGYRPANGTQKTQYLGEANMESCNMGVLSLKICKKHVRTIDGPGAPDFNHRAKDAFDDWEPVWIMEAAAEIMLGSSLTAGDAKNSE